MWFKWRVYIIEKNDWKENVTKRKFYDKNEYFDFINKIENSFINKKNVENNNINKDFEKLMKKIKENSNVENSNINKDEKQKPIFIKKVYTAKDFFDSIDEIVKNFEKKDVNLKEKQENQWEDNFLESLIKKDWKIFVDKISKDFDQVKEVLGWKKVEAWKIIDKIKESINNWKNKVEEESKRFFKDVLNSNIYLNLEKYWEDLWISLKEYSKEIYENEKKKLDNKLKSILVSKLTKQKEYFEKEWNSIMVDKIKKDLEKLK